jgi:hypothetical protein
MSTRSISTKLTRRQAAIGIISTTAALAQTPTPVQPIPQTPEDELKAMQIQMRTNSETLGKIEIPQLTEPAFIFRP